MKKTFVIVSCLAFGALTGYFKFHTHRLADEFLLMNVEALASNESSFPLDCKGSGDVECPNGVRVAVYNTIYSLR